MGYKWQPSRAQKRDFAIKMEEIKNFCEENGIDTSSNMDSFYFSINGKNYRVSNHTIESSNRKAYNWLGEQVREKYHEDVRNANVVYIHAGKTRIIEIYNNLKNGYVLNGRGYITK